MKTIIAKWKKLKKILNEAQEVYKPTYRVASIEQNESGDYTVIIQMIGKAISYRISPEKLLADDKMVDLFSPRDIRNLTYLGYLGIHAPKYKILAQRFSDEYGETVFAIHKKGEKAHTTVTAKDISTNEKILKQLSQEDAHRIGFAAATEQAMQEKRQQEVILRQLRNE